MFSYWKINKKKKDNPRQFLTRKKIRAGFLKNMVKCPGISFILYWWKWTKESHKDLDLILFLTCNCYNSDCLGKGSNIKISCTLFCYFYILLFQRATIHHSAHYTHFLMCTDVFDVNIWLYLCWINHVFIVQVSNDYFSERQIHTIDLWP